MEATGDGAPANGDPGRFGGFDVVQGWTFTSTVAVVACALPLSLLDAENA